MALTAPLVFQGSSPKRTDCHLVDPKLHTNISTHFISGTDHPQPLTVLLNPMISNFLQVARCNIGLMTQSSALCHLSVPSAYTHRLPRTQAVGYRSTHPAHFNARVDIPTWSGRFDFAGLMHHHMPIRILCMFFRYDVAQYSLSR